MATDASGMIMATVTITVGSTLGAQFVRKEKLSIRPVLGGFALGTILLLGAMVSPGMAIAFCWLTIIGALLINGVTVFGAVGLID